MDELNDTQIDIVSMVAHTVTKWINSSQDFKPLRLTVAAGAGRGKSYVIHQITTMLRRLFNSNEVVTIASFTGASAFNVGGKTIHSAFAVNISNPDECLSQAARSKLMKEFRYTVAILLDERSMISAQLLGCAERNVRSTCHGGGKEGLDWGGVPVVIVFGDDCQLPPVNIQGNGVGAFQCIETTVQSRVTTRKSIINGLAVFNKLTESVVIMNKHERTNEQVFINLQDRVRIGSPSPLDIDELMALNYHRLPDAARRAVDSDPTTVHLFSTRASCLEHNIKRLHLEHSDTNPVAFIKSTVPKKRTSSNDDLCSIPKQTVICRGAKVCIRGYNFNPLWGLYNGSIGTVVEIVYEKNHSPNSGHFPLYVLVDFPSYKGHLQEYGSNIFISEHPQWVPIPTIKQFDTSSKKTVIFCPLQLSYARTIHTFQGFQSGPNHNIHHIICDVGNALIEGLFPGIFYSALSRASTIGTRQDTYRLNSAVYFIYLDEDRLMRLRKKKNGDVYDLVKRRDLWLQHLEKRHTVTQQSLTLLNKKSILRHVSTDVYSIQKIDDRSRT